MQILPQFATLSPCQVPPALRAFRLVLRFALLVLGIYAIYRGEQYGKALAAKRAADLKAHQDKLRRETEAYFERCDNEMTRIYRGINTIASYAGLESIGDGR